MDDAPRSRVTQNAGDRTSNGRSGMTRVLTNVAAAGIVFFAGIMIWLQTNNGTLLIDRAMWTYSPKVNSIVKVPSSMMGQGWMGSDFSNQDIARSDEIVEDYRHVLLETRQTDEHTVYVIECRPLEDAAVVWGKRVLQIRDDYIVLQDQFYDQDGALVKQLVTLNVAILGGRSVAQRQRMEKLEAAGEWTEVTVAAQSFDIELSPNLFTLSSLRNPRQ